MSISILHITDLHLNDFEGNSELLRRRFFEEYIDKLFIKVKADGYDKVDYIVLTGDFSDRGKTENFGDVEKIISYLAKTFGVNEANICCTIGNHDYKWKEEKADFSNSVELRQPFYDFIKKYEGTILKSTHRYFFKQLTDKFFFLSLDSTLKSIDGNPGAIDDSEIDEVIVDVLKKYLDEDSTLLIGCHFPIISYENNFLASQEPNWHEKHVWIKASGLYDRIKNIKIKNTIWFHGDVHASDQKELENATFLLTGRFGGDINKTSEFPRQAIVINIDDEDQRVYTYNYRFSTHLASAHIGEWESSGSKSIRTVQPVSLIKQKPSEDVVGHLSIVNDEIEAQIMTTISENELFKFGRFKTSYKHSSLGWINVNKLMNSPALLSRITEKSFSHIDANVTCSSSECLFIGLEVIGGIIASQLSVRTNTKNYIFPIRGNDKFYSSEETNKELLFAHLVNTLEVVIFIDVISSGNTIAEFVQLLISKNQKMKIHVISIISNNMKSMPIKIEGVTSYGTFCNKLKIPLVENDNLPEESIFPSTLDFTGQN